MLHGAWRVVRGGYVAAAVLGIAVVGHVTGGGIAELNSPAFLVLAALMVPVAILLSEREWTFARLVLTLGAAQLAIHVALMTASPADSMPAMAGMPTSSTAASGLSSLAMLASHVAAVVVTAALLRHGEKFAQALWTQIQQRITLRPVWRPAPLAAVTRVAVAASQSFVAESLLASRAISRRGPPLGLVQA